MTSTLSRFSKQWYFHLAILVSALIAIAGRYVLADWSWQNYLFKPLTTLLICLLAATAPAPGPPRYRNCLVLGLFCSLAGDIFLMLPRQMFLAGLVCFLLAHICYLAAFFSDSKPSWHISSPLLLLPGAFVFWRIQSGISSSLYLPVLLYLVVITVMAHQAYVRALTSRSAGKWMAAAGALLFVVSDAVLALNKFHARFAHAGLWILGTYYVAQWLLAASACQTSPGLTEKHDARNR